MNRVKIVVLLAVFVSVGCASPERTGVLVADGAGSVELMDFRNPPALDPTPPGWHHRLFRRQQPMDISFVEKDGRAAVRLHTSDSASMLFRWVDVDLSRYPVLSWDWLIEQPVVTDLDEMTSAGDDHPARLYLTFESPAGDEHSMEIIWGNKTLARGDWKHTDFLGFFSFPHYTANGGEANVGSWHHERVDLDELYTTLWGDPAGARLTELALFCDTDATGAESTAYFSEIRVEAR